MSPEQGSQGNETRIETKKPLWERELPELERKMIDETVAHWRSISWQGGSSLHLETAIVEFFEEKFMRAGFLMDAEEQEKCTRLYVQHIVGVIIPEDWQQGRSQINLIGRILNYAPDVGLPLKRGAIFWKNLNSISPGFISDNELRWLTENDPMGGGADYLMNRMGTYPKSSLPSRVYTSIIANK